MNSGAGSLPDRSHRVGPSSLGQADQLRNMVQSKEARFPLVESTLFIQDEDCQCVAPYPDSPMPDSTQLNAPSKEAIEFEPLELTPDPVELPLSEKTVDLEFHFGDTRLTESQLAQLSQRSIVELDQEVNEPLEIWSNGQIVGRGRIMVQDGCYCIRVLDLDSSFKVSQY